MSTRSWKGRNFIGVDAMRAKFGDCGRTTLYRWEADGIIPKAIKIGNRRLWDETIVDDHIAAAQAVA